MQPARVAHDKTGFQFLDGPMREARGEGMAAMQ